MKLIPLANSPLCAMVDDEDYHEVSKLTWKLHTSNTNNYARANMRGKTVELQRFLCPDYRPMIDHIDNDGLNNQRSNLRPCTNSQNQCNRKTRHTHFKGVRIIKGFWISRICLNGERLYLGAYRSKVLAAFVYDVAARILHGEFANSNFLSLKER